MGLTNPATHLTANETALIRYPSAKTFKGLNYYAVPESEKLTKMRQRKEVKMTRKQSKNVKNVRVTQEDTEEYNIDDVLKELGENKPKEKERKKHKKKSKREEQNRESGENVTDLLGELNIDSASTIDPILDEQEKLNEIVPTLSPLNEECQNTEPEQIEDKITDDIATESITDDFATEAITDDNPTKAITDDIPTEPECSICFNSRPKSFVFYPCGHATFCETCANRIVIELKKCPTCQNPIIGSCPIFQ